MSMKKLLLFTLMFTLIGSTMQAQECVADSSFIMPGVVGVFPLPDSVDSPMTSLPIACVDVPYELVFTAIVPDSVSLGGSMIDLTSVQIDDITGLPPGTDAYFCEPDASCLFVDNSVGCLAIKGTPTQAGTYSLVVETTVNGALPVTFPGLLVAGEYKIVVSPPSECSLNTDNAFKEALGMRQNIPNPFSDVTIIEMDAQVSGEFDFKVFNLVGKMVHNEQVNILVGENTITFDGSRLEQGMYFYSIGQGSNIATKRMVINR